VRLEEVKPKSGFGFLRAGAASSVADVCFKHACSTVSFDEAHVGSRLRSYIRGCQSGVFRLNSHAALMFVGKDNAEMMEKIALEKNRSFVCVSDSASSELKNMLVGMRERGHKVFLFEGDHDFQDDCYGAIYSFVDGGCRGFFLNNKGKEIPLATTAPIPSVEQQ